VGGRRIPYPFRNPTELPTLEQAADENLWWYYSIAKLQRERSVDPRAIYGSYVQFCRGCGIEPASYSTWRWMSFGHIHGKGISRRSFSW
jgi:hypothetical protein